jgi:methylglyoxal synthase
MRKTLALVAHDSKKEHMVRLAKAYKENLSELDLVATRGTGQAVQARAGLAVTLVQSGPHGGDQQIGALVANGDVSAVIFLRDPLMAHPHEPDVSALLRVCDVHNVPLATNIASAEAVLYFLSKQTEALEEHRSAAQFTSEMASVY